MKNLLKAYFSNTNIDIASIFIITSVWLLMIILVNPIGNFPLDDDWAYGWTVKTLLETGKFQLSDWAATNLLPQALWGFLFCLPFGFSFTALRFSTLFLGLLGIIATYGLSRETGISPKNSLLSTLVVAFNPIYFGLSNSFTSDVPSFTLCIVSVYFLVRGTYLDSRRWTILGLIFSLVSILNRQSSLVILPAFGVAYLIRKGITLRNSIKASLPTFVGILIYLSYSYWLSSTGRTPLLYALQVTKLTETLSSGPRVIAFTYFENIWLFAIYLGLFLFPLLALQFSQLFKTFSTRQKQINLYLTAFLVAIGLALILKRQQMPLIGNTLDVLGLGPLSLDGYNAFLADNRSLRILIRASWAFLTLIGMFSVSMLLQYLGIAVQALLSYRVKANQSWLLMFLLASSILYFLPIGAIGKGYWFDRYLILLLPLLIAGILTLTKSSLGKVNFTSKTVFPVLIMLFCLEAFTIGATHDYLLWNRVRWLALDNLMQHSKVLPNQIGGGMEFNGWFFGNRIETCNPEFQQNTKDQSVGWENFSCLWDDANREYLVSFAQKPDFDEYAAYSFRRWLPWREEVLYVLHKHE